jgi:hypothetical protein
MPQVGFELTIPVFERAKRVHALDPAATVPGVKCGLVTQLTIILSRKRMPTGTAL